MGSRRFGTCFLFNVQFQSLLTEVSEENRHYLQWRHSNGRQIQQMPILITAYCITVLGNYQADVLHVKSHILRDTNTDNLEQHLYFENLGTTPSLSTMRRSKYHNIIYFSGSYSPPISHELSTCTYIIAVILVIYIYKDTCNICYFYS